MVGALLVYVFGWATDWRAARALRAAHAPLFLARRDRAPRLRGRPAAGDRAALSSRTCPCAPFAVRGGSELIRTVSNPASDAPFFLGSAARRRRRRRDHRRCALCATS
jgi:hypothetical protein